MNHPLFQRSRVLLRRLFLSLVGRPMYCAASKKYLGRGFAFINSSGEIEVWGIAEKVVYVDFTTRKTICFILTDQDLQDA
jgi:hypothetical protein